MNENQMMLECVGCGQKVCEKPVPGTTLAIACRCGANAPILVKEGTDNLYGLPGSLIMGITLKHPVPHLEYYLGHSAHTSELKNQVEKLLRVAGCISEAECKECRTRSEVS